MEGHSAGAPRTDRPGRARRPVRRRSVQPDRPAGDHHRVARNPLAIVVPCHRVVGAPGAMTGYGGGLEHKRLLLELEARVARW